MNPVFANLRNIGIFFATKATDQSDTITTPEDALIGALPIIKSDRLTLALIYTWFRKNADWIHLESLLKKSEVLKDPVHLAFLAALLASSQNRNLVQSAGKIKFRKDRLNQGVDKTLRLAAEIGQVEFDPVFLRFGLKISKLHEEPERKFIPREFILQSNPFLFCRSLFGTNWRADVAAMLMLRPDSNPTMITKTLGCSYETAHRNHRTLMTVGWPRLNQNLLSPLS